MDKAVSSLAADAEFGFLDRSVPSRQRHNPQLIRNDGPDTMLRAIKAELARSRSFVFSVAFITPGALALLKQELLDFPGQGTIVTSTYLNFNDPATFRELLLLPNIDVRVVCDDKSGFHAKGYVFTQSPEVTAIVGSSNLTRHALLQNHEWNLRFSAMPDGDIIEQLANATSQQLADSTPLTHDWVDYYEATWNPHLPAPAREAGLANVMPSGRVAPNAMQVEALDALEAVRAAGEERALIVSATGTGKTILAALAAREMASERILFVAHREQILEKATEEFARVLEVPCSSFGRLAGGRRDLSKRHVFATIQSLARPDVLRDIERSAFDLIIVDEVHRAGAASYRRIIDYFTPHFLLGLTATPERTDDFNVFEIFDFNVPYEIRLQQALEAGMLAPFNYYGVEDFVDRHGETVSDASRLATLTAGERVDHVVRMMEMYGHLEGVKGLIFCGRNEEASRLSQLLNERMVHGRSLRTVAMTGADSIEQREEVVKDLEAGRIDYILTVDIFNEGIDIPAVNQVVMLRRTQSSIIFTQQLGRGLRKAMGKDHLRVIDFIGNYDNNFLIPIALFGDSSLNKDVIRKKLIESQAAGAIAGVSSINFQEVSRDRIFESLAKTKLDSMQNLKRAVADLEQRLGATPRLLDFARFDTVDPVLMATKKRCYWSLLVALRRVSERPVTEASDYLTFLSMELLNGKRPHELLVLRRLLEEPNVRLTENDLRKLLETGDCSHDTETIASVIRVLSFEFATKQDRGRYGHEGVITERDGAIELHGSFRRLYLDYQTFRVHVDDAIETGLYLARHRYAWSGRLKVGERYSRKDACRLLNWMSNQQGVIYGYKTDIATSTCPIFITYHKAEDVSDSMAYEDAFLDPATLRWFTRSDRTLGSREVQDILGNEHAPALHVFVKKDDAESSEFYYIGEATPRDPKQEVMSSSEGKPLNVVTMKLDLEAPVQPEMYDYFTEYGAAERNRAHSMPADWGRLSRIADWVVDPT